MSEKDDERLVAEIKKPLKDRAKADPRSIKDIVESALEREFSTAKTAAVERRIDEKKQRIQTLEREINERKREKATEEDELARLQSQLAEFDDAQDEQLAEARDALAETPKEPDNVAIKKWAKRLGMTPDQLLDEL